MLIQSDAKHIPLRDDVVSCCVTSPPYWRLRSYLPGEHPHKELEIGLETTIAEYVGALVEVFREVRRVLHPSGVLWLNLGDTYCSDGGHADVHCTDRLGQYNLGNRPEHNRRDLRAKPSYRRDRVEIVADAHKRAELLKCKDLCEIPSMVAMALRADGWYLRSRIPWVKTNSMPDSTKDRPGRSVEYIFMLAKSEIYFYDDLAVRLPLKSPDAANGKRPIGGHRRPAPISHPQEASRAYNFAPSGRNRRESDWITESLLDDDDGNPLVLQANPSPYKKAHYATFPPKMVRPLILAGTSERGCCPACRAPWRRVTERTYHNSGDTVSNGTKRLRKVHLETVAYPLRLEACYKTTGWEPSCDCAAGDPVPCVVFDPFCGTGVTQMVARDLGRVGIGSDLTYQDLAAERIQGPLFAKSVNCERLR